MLLSAVENLLDLMLELRIIFVSFKKKTCLSHGQLLSEIYLAGADGLTPVQTAHPAGADGTHCRCRRHTLPIQTAHLAGADGSPCQCRRLTLPVQTDYLAGVDGATEDVIGVLESRATEEKMSRIQGVSRTNTIAKNCHPTDKVVQIACRLGEEECEEVNETRASN